MRLSRKKEAGLDHGLEATNAVEAKESPEDSILFFIFPKLPENLYERRRLVSTTANAVEAKEFPLDSKFQKSHEEAD